MAHFLRVHDFLEKDSVQILVPICRTLITDIDISTVEPRSFKAIIINKKI